MLLAELLDNPRIGLVRLVDGHGDGVVRGVYTTDLPDPGRYLGGGELVLTSTTWYRGAHDAEVFVAALKGAGATALVAGTAGVGELPEPVVEACTRHGLALFTVGDEVSFATVTETVLAALAGPHRRSPGAGLHRSLVASMAAGEGPEGLVEVFARASGVWCAVLSATGRPTAGHLPDVTDHQLALVHREALAAGAFPAVRPVPGGGSLTFFPVQSPVARRPPAAYLVARGDYRDWTPGTADGADEVCALLALDRIAGAERRRVEERFLREALDLLTAGQDAAAEGRLRSLGLQLPLSALVVSTTGSAYGAELAGVVLEEVAGQLPGCSVPIAADGTYLILVPGPEAASAAARAEEAATLLTPLLGQGRAAIGHGAPAAGVRRSLEEARLAHGVAAARTGTVRSAGSTDLSSYHLLLASVPDEVRTLFRQRLIGVLEEYDAGHRSDLVGTLAAFLDASGSWQACAERLHIHVNTLRYRVQRIEELTGHGLATLRDRVDFVLAQDLTPPGKP